MKGTRVDPQGGRWEAKEGQQRSVWHLSSFTFLLRVQLILSTCTREPLPPKPPLLQTRPDIEKHACALFLWFCCNWNSATPESSWHVSWRGTGNPPVFRRLPGHPGVIIMSVEGRVSQEVLGKARMKWDCSWDVIDVLWVDEARLGSWGPRDPATSGLALGDRLGSGRGPTSD